MYVLNTVNDLYGDEGKANEEIVDQCLAKNQLGVFVKEFKQIKEVYGDEERQQRDC